ncbi:unnamed protein product [Prorocentrum cordatum]|uniref:Uncharacterized protein n=1 Tax=Prorocentrum cordatum TaxID=2364126 RepID=A0ABN9XSM1_9DINO|nr:unnamed protein product [Polarella glacialis]
MASSATPLATDMATSCASSSRVTGRLFADTALLSSLTLSNLGLCHLSGVAPQRSAPCRRGRRGRRQRLAASPTEGPQAAGYEGRLGQLAAARAAGARGYDRLGDRAQDRRRRRLTGPRNPERPPTTTSPERRLGLHPPAWEEPRRGFRRDGPRRHLPGPPDVMDSS